MSRYKIDNYQRPNSDEDIEKCLIGAFKFKRGEMQYYPDEDIHTMWITHSAYEKGIENLKVSVVDMIKDFEYKGYELTEKQTELIARVLMSNYKVYSDDAEKRETYSDFISNSVYKHYSKDNLLNLENKDTGFSDEYSTAKSVVDYLAKVEKGLGSYQQVQDLTKARRVVMDLHRHVSRAGQSLYSQLRTMEFNNTLKKVANPNLRDAITAYLG